MTPLNPGLLTTGATVVFELIGPVVTRWTLIHVGDSDTTQPHSPPHKKERS